MTTRTSRLNQEIVGPGTTSANVLRFCERLIDTETSRPRLPTMERVFARAGRYLGRRLELPPTFLLT